MGEDGTWEGDEIKSLDSFIGQKYTTSIAHAHLLLVGNVSIRHAFNCVGWWEQIGNCRSRSKWTVHYLSIIDSCTLDSSIQLLILAVSLRMTMTYVENH